MDLKFRIMTITQLEYIVAVADCKSFAKAAEKCHVTQPTLSVQIKKLEAHLDVAIFDRTKKPVRPTEIGIQIIEQARISLGELNRISEIIRFEEHEGRKKLRLGIIPTLSPYLLPMFSLPFLEQNPNIQLIVNEMISEDIIYSLYNNKIDIGILVSPDDTPDLKQITLFYESFILYVSKKHAYSNRKEIKLDELDLNDMWILTEGHCFRSQTFSICGERTKSENRIGLRFESGSLESLRRIVEQQDGYTMLPKLATLEFQDWQEEMVKELETHPAREISLLINRGFMKRKVVESLKQSILENIPSYMKTKDGKTPIAWT